MTIEGKQPGWWEQHKDGTLPKSPLYLEHEQTCLSLWGWDGEYIPGLLQTPEYFHHALAMSARDPSDESIQSILEVRLDRQERFWSRTDLSDVQFLIGWAALQYLTTLPLDDANAQLNRISSAQATKGIEIKIPVGLHAAMGPQFTIVTPAAVSDAPGVPFVYLESGDGCRYIEEPTQITGFRSSFEKAFSQALPLEEFLNDHNPMA